MTTTYTPDFTTTRDKIRRLIGDVGSGSVWLLTDEEIAYLGGATPADLGNAAANCAEAIAAGFAAQVSMSNMSLSVSFGERAAQYRALADRLRAQSGLNGAATVDTVFFGGIETSERERLALDTAQVQPAFSPGQHDNLLARNPYNPLKRDRGNS